jgi:hypothetical protein
MGLKWALRSGKATHSLGNQIDKVLSNKPIIFIKSEEGPFPMNHFVISATISIKSSIDS